jgi:kinesin family protein 3/17
MEQDLQNKKEMKLNINQKFGSIQEEIQNTDMETERVWTRFQMTKGELDDAAEMIHREREDLMDRIRELTREIRLKHLIIDQFIPAQEYMKIERRAEWSDQANEWIVPNA